MANYKPITKDSLILVVDDFPTMRKIIKSVLKDCGCQNVIEAENGQKAMDTLTANPAVDLIVSDWHMSPMNGTELLKAVRAHADERARNLPFMLVFSETEKDKIAEAVESGLNAYVMKPFTAATIQQAITKINVNR
jgi:two-component system chemotaxis response regulator CheY